MEEKKKNKLQELTADVNKLEQLKAGALAKAKAVAAQLQSKGVSLEDIKKNEDYLKCQSAFTDFSSTLVEKNNHIGELEGEIGQSAQTISSHKVQLQQLLRDIDKIKSEAAGAIADVITAKEEQQIADMLSGISQDGTAKELQDMRDLRQQVKANARVSRELAGTDNKKLEADSLDYATKTPSNSEFDALIGLAEKTDKSAASSESAKKEARLPEA